MEIMWNGEQFDDPDGFNKLKNPYLALQDYYNEISGLIACAEMAKTDTNLLKTLADIDFKGMRTFRERFPSDQYPGLIESQAPEILTRLEAIAQEVNILYFSGQLSIEKLKIFAEEMRQICYQ